MSKKGGYVIVDLKGQSITAGTPFTLDGVTARLNRAKNKACLLSGFAIGNEEKRDVFVDLQKTEDGYVALFGQYTITIEDDEVTITDGGILMDNIVDSQGNKRFIGGKANLSEVTGVTFTYNKWSLSGTHLMLVVCFDVANETELPNSTTMALFNVPKWVLDKIVPLYASNFIEGKLVTLYGDNWSVQQYNFTLSKVETGLRVITQGNVTLTANRHVRVQFDLLIDSDAE